MNTDSQSAWSKTSIVNIKNDKIASYSGNASVSGNKMTLNGVSEILYNYKYNTSNKLIHSEKLKFVLNVDSSNNSDHTRYNENVCINIYIQYFEETYDAHGEHTGWVDGAFDTLIVNPYLNNEVDGYNRSFDLDIKDDPIKLIKIQYCNNGNSVITFNDPKLYYSMNTYEAVDDALEDSDYIEETIKEDVEDYIDERIEEGTIVFQRYKVPEMTLAEWIACDKEEYNECIIIGN